MNPTLSQQMLDLAVARGDLSKADAHLLKSDRLSCGGKVRLESKYSAELHAAERGVVEWKKFKVYFCRWCSFWHVGHVNKSDRVSRKRRMKIHATGSS